MESLVKDIRYGIRNLLKRPGFTAIAVVTLALGIGANTAIFSVVNAVLLRHLPIKNQDQVMWVWSSRTDKEKAPFTLADFIDYRDQNQTLEQIAAFANIGVNLSGAERAERLQGLRVSANLFQLLGVDAVAGRTLLPDDDEPASRHVVVLTQALWQRRFGNDRELIGKTLSLNNESYAVVGVLPASFSLPVAEAEFAIPLSPDADPSRNVRTSVNFLRAVARLKPGVTRQQAEADVTAIVSRERAQYGAAYLTKTGVRLVPLYEEVVGSVQTALWVLLGAVGLVFLIACTNLTALSLARASARQREMAIRKTLGATSTRLLRQLLTESLLLAFFGGGAGFLLAVWGVRFLLMLSPTRLPRDQEIGVDLRVLAFAAVVSMLAAVVFGIFLALQAARTDLSGELRGGRGAGEGARYNRPCSLLVIAEVALSFVLLIGAGLLIKSFLQVQAIKPGFDPTNALAVRLSLPKAKYKDRASVALFCDQLLPRIQALPGVEAVGEVSILPMSFGGLTVHFTLAGRASSPADAHLSELRLITPDYFRAMGIPLLQGRQLNEHDNARSVPVVLVNAALAQRFWPNGNPIGAHINIDDNDTGPRPVEIVGVVADVRQASLEGEPTFDVYAPIAQTHEDAVALVTNNQYWVVRSKTDSRTLEAAFRRELVGVDRDVPASNVRTVEDYLSDSVAPRKFNLRVLTIFSIVALVLAATGLYGMVSYTVTQRTQEIGIRLALGARRTNVFRLVLRQGLGLAVTGVAFGLVGAFALTRLIRGLLFGVSPTDPVAFGAIAVLLLAVALLACCLPARRATKVDPLVALRYE